MYRELPWDERSLGLLWKGYRVVALVKRSSGVEKPSASSASSASDHKHRKAHRHVGRLRSFQAEGLQVSRKMDLPV